MGVISTHLWKGHIQMLETQTTASGEGQILSTFEGAFGDVPVGRGAMAVMGVRGDTKYLWDKTKPVEVEAARAQFTKFREQGYLAFAVTGKNGDKGEQIREFDPNLDAIIFAPQMRGG
jgi:hypothetical protein